MQLSTGITKIIFEVFPGGPVVKNPPADAGDTSSIPSWGTKIPHAAEHLNLSTSTTEPMHLKSVPTSSSKAPAQSETEINNL